MHVHTPPGLKGLRWSRPASRGASSPPALDLLLDAAEQFAPGTHIGISVLDGDAVTTLAGTHSVVFVLDQLQHDLDEGPSLTAIRDGHIVIVDDATDEPRWPAFNRQAAATGLCSLLAVPLVINEQTLGAVSMYSMAPKALSANSFAFASMFATQAAIIVAQAQRERDLVLALQTSTTTAKAVGLVMERFCIDDDEAAAYLGRLSRASGLALHEIAGHLVDQSNDLWHSTESDRTTRIQPSVAQVTPVPERSRGDHPLRSVPGLQAPTLVDGEEGNNVR